MDFQYFLKQVPNLVATALPALKAHTKMAPLNRLETISNPIGKEIVPREAAVLMLLYPKDKTTHLVLILRNSYDGVHSAQVAFPGGKYEKTDVDLSFTALRETQEEVGINPTIIEVIKPFTPMYIPPSNFMVHPFLGIAIEELHFLPDPDEVAQIIELPLALLLNERNVIEAKLTISFGIETIVPAFDIDNNIVWGATAMMLSELKEVLKSVFKDAVQDQ